VNSHVPIEIQKKYPNYVFIGKRKIIKNREVIKAHNPATCMKFYYSFEEDMFWMISMGVPDWKMLKI
jgi:hypothetical protein